MYNKLNLALKYPKFLNVKLVLHLSCPYKTGNINKFIHPKKIYFDHLILEHTLEINEFIFDCSLTKRSNNPLIFEYSVIVFKWFDLEYLSFNCTKSQNDILSCKLEPKYSVSSC
ncbi:hypothetical protein BpHYR1_032510 [Brachionus plicatilis]|uniref:Uncharacterized protein n=1 Tax=Brachionus plicatilis TaxID=10195 RepID=A0A3M7Q4V8_BRAPC|nr:hypothetical protein BpHYR1_032510 [Brachionus plicatilis]